MTHRFMRTSIRTMAILGWLGGTLAAQAMAATVQNGQVQVQLVASVNQVRPGEQITVGLQQHIQPGWHTYWLNPGDSGLATTIEWTLPTGASAGDIQWPLPHRFVQGSVGNFGYDTDVTLLSRISVPAKLRSGASFPIGAKVRWLACRDVCVPQEATVQLVLPVTHADAVRMPTNPSIDASLAQLPVPAPWPVLAQQRGKGMALRVPQAALGPTPVKAIWFYPSEAGPIDHMAAQYRVRQGKDVSLLLTSGSAPLVPGQTLKGLLVITHEVAGTDRAEGYWIDTPLRPFGGLPSPHAETMTTDRQGAVYQTAEMGARPSPASSLSLGVALLLALMGGMVLNLMPCVFPVLSIKTLALIGHREHTARHGLAYTAGVLASFALLGGVMIAIKAGGAQAGWGFQFQSPVFVLLMAYLMFVVGLSLSGVFTIGQSVTGLGSSLAAREGYTGSFFTGVLATIVATPCTAPFMGGAIGFALTQPPAALMAVFLSLGLGLALPYLLLSVWPALQRRLPRPGVWMERVKQVLAFPMYGAAVWLVWVLAQQAGVDAATVALSGMVLLAFGAWSYDSSRMGSAAAQLGGAALAVLAVAGALTGGCMGVQAGEMVSPHMASAPIGNGNLHAWEPYSPERLETLREQGQPVFVNLTAAWCITCLVNERVALGQPAVLDAIKTEGIHYLKGDWTNQNADVGQLLKQFGRGGVPLYVFFPNGRASKPVVLPQVLTPDIVLATLKEPISWP